MPKPGSTYSRSEKLAETTLAETEIGPKVILEEVSSAVTEVVAEIRSASTAKKLVYLYTLCSKKNMWPRFWW